MAAHGDDLDGAAAVPFLDLHSPPRQPRRWPFSFFSMVALIIGTFFLILLVLRRHVGEEQMGPAVGFRGLGTADEMVTAEHGVVAADDGRCSDIGVAALKAGGHAVDAAVATALCLGVVNPMSSGIGGGAFMVVRSAATGRAEAFDSRESAPLASSQNMYDNNPSSKSKGALSLGVPGELAGLYEAWSRHGRLPWKSLVQPSISLAGDGFGISPFLAVGLQIKESVIRADPGLRRLFVRNGRLLRAGDITRNPALARTLAAVADAGPRTAFYDGALGEALASDVRAAGGLLTVEDLRSYKVKVADAVAVDAFGYTILGMPPPSSGTVGLSMVLKILAGYEDHDCEESLHRLVEAMKHMFAKRMDLGDPAFVNVSTTVSDMLSSSFAEKIRRRINDSRTFGQEYYLPRWSQLRDDGTSHLCVVDSERNAVSMTTTVNAYFGAGVLSPSTGVVLNNEMDDFSTPAESTPDQLPPAPSNFIQPMKRPLSSMAPIIVVKGDQLAGIIGASGGMRIIPAVAQVFLNHFVLGMSPLDAVKQPRVYHKLIPNVAIYENLTTTQGVHIEMSTQARTSLSQRGHVLSPVKVVAVSQLVVHDLQNPVHVSQGMKNRKLGHGQRVLRGLLTAVSDPRKGGSPSGI